jgi:site-specific DNA recombinase
MSIRGGRCPAPYLRVPAVEEAMVAYHATLTYTSEEQRRIRQAVRDFIAPRAKQARKQADTHQRRLRDLQAEQQRLVQLAYKNLVDDDVLAAEQDRIRQERAEARRWIETAVHEVQDVMDALDEALALVDDYLPYADASPVQRKLLNQATHERLYPRLIDGGAEVTGVRNPVYVEADLIAGKDPPERHIGLNRPGNARKGQETTKAPIPQGLGSDKISLAEGEGFEPSVRLPAQRFSRPPDSATLAPLRGAGNGSASGGASPCSLRRWTTPP